MYLSIYGSDNDKRINMKTIFRYKGIEHGYRVVNGKVHNYKTSGELDSILELMEQNAEHHDISNTDKEILQREKMELCHDWELNSGEYL